ncbi:MAG: SUMF1/EgtB/PvdO family nonheme iron enzyme, partial [Deltaproteobacteria bacterium]|nr:SUMF1/EgtB/PvdO family nonheme iron enzyme [Deltaproteobacteria bacterium]
MRPIAAVFTVFLLFVACDSNDEVKNCGNSIIDIGEECDTDDYNGSDCRSLGYYGGTISCTSECKFDLSSCEDAGYCGDGLIHLQYELCEGTDLNDQTCEGLGYSGGTLGCDDKCRFDISQCTGGENCGNGSIQDPEECDGDDLGDKTCSDFSGFIGGVLMCGTDCRFDTKNCETEANCGDGSVQPGEECDGDDLDGKDCLSMGFQNGGSLSCNGDCTFNVSECLGTSNCGNGSIDEGEECDGTLLGNVTCGTLGYYGGGDLTCTTACTLNTSGCQGGYCGNGSVESVEDCDGNNLDNATCGGMGFYGGGNLSCSDVCKFDTSGCLGGYCGNGTVETGEECDGTSMGGLSCGSLGYYGGGNLSCTADCTIEETNCVGGYCGNGVLESDYEVCEGNDLNGMTCEDLGFEGGVLLCSDMCIFDTSGCIKYVSPYVGNMIEVPAGTFQRDSNSANLSTVSSFIIGQHEITRVQFAQIMGTEPSDQTYSSGVSDPVQTVNWYHAIAFCNKLSIAEGRSPVYTVSGVDFSTLTYEQIPTTDNATWNEAAANWSANGYRLPTEMEWMWAAMGADTANIGGINTDGYMKLFAGSNGSNVIDNYAWYQDNS